MTSNARPKVRRANEHETVETSWGRLIWQVSGARANSELLTVGVCYIKPGCENPRHSHPNCEEVLTVTRGHIVHTWNDEAVEMREGDVIAIPSGIVHNARNIGEGMAELNIAFSSAYRETITEANSRETA